jgi:putative membrane protein
MYKKNSITVFSAIMSFSLLFIAFPSSAQKSKMKLSDAEIASVAVTANQVDIDAAKLAEKKSKNAEVLNFAKTMISDHQSVIDKAVALVTKLHVTPKDNAMSRQLKAGGIASNRSLNAKHGRSFDRAYVTHEVAYHKAVISAVEKTLIPDAQNAELKSLLESVLPVLRTHLEHAQMVEKKMK